MHYRYALAEGAMFRPVHWKEACGEAKDFESEIQLFRYAEAEGWDLVQVLATGHDLHFRQWYFKMTEA